MLTHSQRQMPDIRHVINHFAHDLAADDWFIVVAVRIAASDILDCGITGLVCDNPVSHEGWIARDGLKGDDITNCIVILRDGDHHVTWRVGGLHGTTQDGEAGAAEYLWYHDDGPENEK